MANLQLQQQLFIENKLRWAVMATKEQHLQKQKLKTQQKIRVLSHP